MTEKDAHALVCTKGDWSRDDYWRLYCNFLEEGKDVVAIVFDDGQCLSGDLLCLTWFRRLLVLFFDGDNAVFIVVVVCLAGVFSFLRTLRDGARKNLQELARVRLPMENCCLCEKWREEDSVARRSVPLLLR